MNKIKNLIKILIISILSIFILTSSANAVNLTIAGTLLSPPNWYCNAQGVFFKDDVDATYRRPKWEENDETGKLELAGYEHLSQNAKITNIFSGPTTTTISSENQNQAVRAYILAHGTGWQNGSGEAQLYVWGEGTETALYAEALEYVNEINDPFIKDTGSAKFSYNDEVGPFIIEWDNTNSDKEFSDADKGGSVNAVSKLTDLVVTYLDGTKAYTSTSEVKIMQNGKELSSPNDIEQNVPFYIINPYLEKEVTSIEIDINKKVRYFHVTEEQYQGITSKIENIGDGWKFESSTEWKPSTVPQDIEHVTYYDISRDKPDKIILPVKIKKGDIELTKKGVYDDKEEMLPNVMFKVYCNEVGKYIKSAEERAQIEFTENIEEAKSYTTGKDGIVLVENLYAGRLVDGTKKGYTYKLIEVDGGKNYYYIDPIKIEASTLSYNTDSAKADLGIMSGHITIGDKKYCTVENITVYYDDTGSENGLRIKTRILIEDARTSGDLTIEKVDETYPDTVKLKGAKFKIKLVKSDDIDEEHNLKLSNLWLKLPGNSTDGNYDFSEMLHSDYLGDESSAGTFVTGKNGVLNIKCIVNGTYEIYETEMPAGYDKTKQDGYGKDPEHPDWVDLGTVTITKGENHIEQRLTNKKVVSKIEGNVWEDGPDVNKSGISEDSYDSLRFTYSDGVIDPGITVNLKDESGNVIASTVTDGTGYWSISKKADNSDIYYWDLTNCYIEFVYDNKTFVCVDPFTQGKAKVDANSKAQEYSLTEEELNDMNLTGTTGNVPGLAVTKRGATYGMNKAEILEKNLANDRYSIEELGLTGYYNDSNYTVENINLGLWRKLEPTYSISESLEYSKVLMNGYTYTYDYNHGSSGKVTDSSMIPATYKQTGATTYGAKVYPSDIAYTAEHNGNGLEMYVVYKITVENTTTTKLTNIYDELRLYLTSLTNTFDSKRYELSTAHNEDSTWDGSKYFGLWENKDSSTANYKIQEDGNVDGDSLVDGINPGANASESVYIQFKVKQSFFEQLIAGTINDEQMNGAVSVAHSIGHHSYGRTDNVWSKEESAKYYKDSKEQDQKQVNGEFLHRSVDVEHSTGELCLLFVLGEERTISGTVYEDDTTKASERNNENLGNGIIDEEEKNRAGNVKVELFDAATEKIATLYQHDATLPEKGYKVVTEGGVATTAKDGYYEIKGIVPGLYMIKLTYPNGETKMFDVNGNEIGDITTNDYKSTIINTEEAGNYIKDALETPKNDMVTYVNIYNNQGNDNALRIAAQKITEWYKYLYEETPENQYNIATDDFETRNNYSEYEYSNENGKTVIKDKNGNVVEELPSITSNSPYFSISIENDIMNRRDVGTSIDGYAHSPKFERFNLGLIKTTVTDIKLDKIISDVKLINSAGATLVQGNPKDAIAYITALDDLPTGSKYARVEMELEAIYGTELEATYRITITNNSIKDYEGKDYFTFGTNKEILKTVTAKEVIDMIDSNYDVSNETLQEIVEHPKQSSTGEGRKIDEVSMEVKNLSTGERYLSFTNWDAIEPEGTTQVEYKAKGIFQEDMDLTYNNNAKINTISVGQGNTIRKDFIWQDDSKTTLFVTPDTGREKTTTYFIIGVVALLILGTGIVVIKKVILK